MKLARCYRGPTNTFVHVCAYSADEIQAADQGDIATETVSLTA